jgi:hypothetical protein
MRATAASVLTISNRAHIGLSGLPAEIMMPENSSDRPRHPTARGAAGGTSKRAQLDYLA